MSKILSKEFKYTNAAKTDIRKTFARVRKELGNLPVSDNQRKPLVEKTCFKTLEDFEEVLGSR